MGLSFFATTASIVRAVDVKQYALSGDITWQTVNLAIWSSLEPYIGILAASLPCLKRPLEGALVHIGLITVNARSSFISLTENSSGLSRSIHISGTKGSKTPGSTVERSEELALLCRPDPTHRLPSLRDSDTGRVMGVAKWR